MEIFHQIEAYQHWRKNVRSAMPHGTLGFVPTMGALHSGHAELLKRARAENQTSVLSIYVNPKQFGPNEDLSKYPRTLEHDLDLARSLGVSAVLVPTDADLYPPQYSTWVNETQLTVPWCGKFRPNHFQGVTTIVLKLFNIVAPTHAYFGLKDAQQFYVLKKMVHDLNIQIEMVGVPTVREASGLALSSRNTYLTAEQRNKTAPIIYQLLQKAGQTLQNKSDPSTLNPKMMLEKIKNQLNKAGLQVQYLELCDLNFNSFSDSLTPLTSGSYLLGVAAYLESVRLIDNIRIEI